MKYPVQKLKSFKIRSLGSKTRRPFPRIVVPSFFTLMNLLSGFLSLILVADANLILGAWLIALAGLFDVLDGVMARLANAQSEFGVELDSICDIVSFGVAPSFLIYHYALYELSIFGMLLSALPALCGAVRLARYNVDTRVAYIDYFRGLPIPGQAIMLAGFTLTFHAGWIFFETMRFGVSTILVPLVVMVSFLMVSTIPFDKLPPFDRESFRYKKARFIQFALYMLLILVFQEYGLMLVFGFYVLKGLLTGGRLFWNDRFGNGEHFVRQN